MLEYQRHEIVAYNRDNRSEFDKIMKIDKETAETYWSARDLMSLYDYNDWRSFKDVISKADEVLQEIGMFGHITHVPRIGLAEEDYKVTRHGAYQIAMKASPIKSGVKDAQQYFVGQTLVAESLAKGRHIGEDTFALIESLNHKVKVAYDAVGSIRLRQDVQDETIIRLEDKTNQSILGVHTSLHNLTEKTKEVLKQMRGYVDQKIDAVREHYDDRIMGQTLLPWQCHALTAAVDQTVFRLIGDGGTVGRWHYFRVWKILKDHFEVGSYREIPAERYDEAVELCNQIDSFRYPEILAPYGNKVS